MTGPADTAIRYLDELRASATEIDLTVISHYEEPGGPYLLVAHPTLSRVPAKLWPLLTEQVSVTLHGTGPGWFWSEPGGVLGLVTDIRRVLALLLRLLPRGDTLTAPASIAAEPTAGCPDQPATHIRCRPLTDLTPAQEHIAMPLRNHNPDRPRRGDGKAPVQVFDQPTAAPPLVSCQAGGDSDLVHLVRLRAALEKAGINSAISCPPGRGHLLRVVNWLYGQPVTETVVVRRDSDGELVFVGSFDNKPICLVEDVDQAVDAVSGAVGASRRGGGSR